MMEGGGNVFSREQDMEFMEMAGKKMYSRDLPDPPDFRDEKNSEEEASQVQDIALLHKSIMAKCYVFLSSACH